MAHEVPRLGDLPPERLDLGEQPVILAGAAARWTAVASWTPGHLEDRIGSLEVGYKLSSSNVHPDFRQTEPSRMFARGRAPFAEFLRLIAPGPGAEPWRFLFTGDEQFSLRRRDGVTTVHPGLEPLLDEVEIPRWVPERRLYTVWNWFSGPGVRTWLHYDNNGCHNLNVQITGQKRCWLYAPEELHRLRPFPLGGGNPAHNCSQIDVERPQPELASELRAAQSWYAELHAGDMLFIPAWWFHTFQHEGEFNSNVNFWWKPQHPAWNAVSARQALVEMAARAASSGANLDAETLRALDAAACSATPAERA